MVPSVEDLERDLQTLVKVGLPQATPEALPCLFSLHVVTNEARGDGRADRVLALEHALKRATHLLGKGDRADAARVLIGLEPGTRSWKRPRRRLAAKDILLDPASELQTFRRRHEKPIIADVAHTLYKLESHVRLGFPLSEDELSALGQPRVPAFSGDELAARDPRLRLVQTHADLKATLLAIVDEAADHLVATGSRSRDPDYLMAIEAKLARDHTLVHYRVLFGPPRWQLLKEHLLRLVQIRDPAARHHGSKTIFIGLFDDFAREPENFVCANERRAFVRLPSLTGIQKYDTGIEIRDPDLARAYVRFVQELRSASRPIETKLDIAKLRVLENPPRGG